MLQTAIDPFLNTSTRFSVYFLEILNVIMMELFKQDTPTLGRSWLEAYCLPKMYYTVNCPQINETEFSQWKRTELPMAAIITSGQHYLLSLTRKYP